MRLSLPPCKRFATTSVLDLMYTVVSEPPASPPIEAAPPPESSPIHEILSNTDAGHGFEDLIAVLKELSTNGDSTPRFSTIFSLLRDRRPEAFEAVSAAQFKTYLQLAESAGVIAVDQHQDGYWWVTLRQKWDTDSDDSRSHTPSPHFGSPFHDLVQILNDLRLAGDPEPQFFIVGPRLLRKNPSVYKDAGVTKFEEYVKAAVKAGVITVRGMKNGDGSLKLCPTYCSPPVRSSTPTRVADPPPTRAADPPPTRAADPPPTRAADPPPTHTIGTASPFTPLVEFLQSKQITSGRPISYSEILAHLLSALGYAGFVSLSTRVPGATTFSQYIDAAITSGVVSLVSGTTASKDALVSVPVGLPNSPSPPAQQSASTTPPPPRSPPPANLKGGGVDPKFVELVETLGELWKKGNKQPLLSYVGSELFQDGRKRTTVLEACGVSNFRACAKLAKDAGIVEICGQGAKQTISLDPTIRVKAGYT